MGFFNKKKKASHDTASLTDDSTQKDFSKHVVTVSNLCFSLVDNVMPIMDKRFNFSKLYESTYACGNYLCWTLLDQDYGKQAVEIAYRSYLRFLQGFNNKLLELPTDELINRFNRSMNVAANAVGMSSKDAFNNPYRLLVKAIMSESSEVPIYDEMLVMQMFMTLIDWNKKMVMEVAQLRLI